MNRFDLIGNLGKSPELRYLPNGTAVATLSVATTRVYRDDAGAKVEKTTWFRVAMFGKKAESAAAHLKQGREIFVSGYMENGDYEKDGVMHYTMNFIAQDIRYLGGGQDREEGAGAAKEAAPAPAARRPAPRSTPTAGTGGAQR